MSIVPYKSTFIIQGGLVNLFQMQGGYITF